MRSVDVRGETPRGQDDQRLDLFKEDLPIFVGPQLDTSTGPGSDSDGSACVDGARISVEESKFCGTWIDTVY